MLINENTNSPYCFFFKSLARHFNRLRHPSVHISLMKYAFPNAQHFFTLNDTIRHFHRGFINKTILQVPFDFSH